MSARVIPLSGKPRRQRRIKGDAPVIMGPSGGGRRLESALSFVNTILANPRTAGVIVSVIDSNEAGIPNTDTRMFGEVRRHPTAFIGSAITQAALDDSFWE